MNDEDVIDNFELMLRDHGASEEEIERELKNARDAMRESREQFNAALERWLTHGTLH